MKPATLASACFAIVLLTGSAVAVAISPELDRLIVGPSLWNMSASDFMLENAPIGFGYESQRRDCARSVNKRLTFLGQPIWEALVYFETGAVKRVEISLYNRGDAGALEEANFRQHVQVLNGALSHWAGSTVTAPDETTKDRANYVTSKRTWIKPPFAVQLSQAYVEPRLLNGTNIPFRSEFVKVAVQRLNSDAQVVKDATTVSWMPGAGAITIRKNVRRSDSGDVWIDGLPMVNQGTKGYCAAASAERLLRYYGRAVDQHQVAQLADTAAKGGTTQEGMLQALEIVGQQFSLEMKAIIKLDWNRMSRLIDDYNRTAAQAGKPLLSTDKRVIQVLATYNNMDAALLRKTKAKQTGEMTQFKNDVKSYISDGVPLLWSCIVGKFPEVPPLSITGVGGHIRLIVGYNEKTSELLYSDSWGAGHELKRMPMDDAWAMTIALHVLKPR